MIIRKCMQLVFQSMYGNGMLSPKNCYYRSQRSWQGNVFTPVCQSFCSRWRGVSGTPGQTPLPPSRNPPRQTPPAGDHCSGRYASYWNTFLLWFRFSFCKLENLVKPILIKQLRIPRSTQDYAKISNILWMRQCEEYISWYWESSSSFYSDAPSRL